MPPAPIRTNVCSVRVIMDSTLSVFRVTQRLRVFRLKRECRLATQRQPAEAGGLQKKRLSGLLLDFQSGGRFPNGIGDESDVLVRVAFVEGNHEHMLQGFVRAFIFFT